MTEDEKNEKLSLLTELIKLARADAEVREAELQFLSAIAVQLGISEPEFKSLFETYIEFEPPALEFERIIQFQRLLLVMNVDAAPNADEIDFIKDLGLRMGLNPLATDEVLRVMDDFPNRVVSPDKLISIFKTFHN